MQAFGILDKMRTTFINPVQYFPRLGDDQVPVNSLVGNQIKLRWTGNIFCTLCNKRTNKSFGEGMCYPCFANSAENAECILRPELCEAHLGKGRDAEWENRNHYKPHFVYLAMTNSIKVGVTRGDQIPTRWIDQGAHKGIILAETPYRQLAGFIEVVLKDHLTDKTHWQKMLRNEPCDTSDLVAEKNRVHGLIPENFQQYKYANDEVVEITYPVLEYPLKVTSISFERMPTIEAKLMGVRGQYFIFENGRVMNIRSKSGYEVELTCQ